MKTGLIISLCTNLGLLFIFKYFNFFIDSFSGLLKSIGFSDNVSSLNIILPVGISFYTFQTLSYTIDIYRKQIKPVNSFTDFALYVSFFPQLVAGPIERAATLIPQITQARKINTDRIKKGVFLILTGLLRKIVIADTAAVLADPIFENYQSCSSLQLASGLVLYSLQIYGDFSGYSNIARGSAKLLGFDLMRNFKAPYFASNPSDFWRRWHISLSTWLRDYLYIPLGGNRNGKFNTYRNLMITMLLGGLWHGASWNFVIWGGLHGLILCCWKGDKLKMDGTHKTIFTFKITQILCTFTTVTFIWLFFRSPDFATSCGYLSGLSQFTFGGIKELMPLSMLVILCLCIDLPQEKANNEYIFFKYPPYAQGLIAGFVIILMTLCGNVQEPFIYFQF